MTVMRFRFYLCIVTMGLVLSACAGGPQDVQTGTPGREASNDPMAMHAAARAQVDTTDFRKKVYTPDGISTQDAIDGKIASATAVKPKPEAPKRDMPKREMDVNFRMLKLEQELASVRDDAKQLLKEQSEPAPEPISEKPVAQPASQKPPAKVKPASAPPVKSKPTAPPSTSRIVQKLRTGDHPDKTRIVIDVSEKSKYRSSLNAAGTVLTISVDNAKGADTLGHQWNGHKLLKSYRAVQSSDRLDIVIDLKKPTRLKKDMALPPNDTNPSYRLVFDIAAL